MKLSLKDELTISVALGSVRSAAGNLANAKDTDEAKRALQELGWEVTAAYDLIATAEREARRRALTVVRTKEPAE